MSDDRAGQPDVAGLVTRLAELREAARPGLHQAFWMEAGEIEAHGPSILFYAEMHRELPALLAAITELQERVRLSEQAAEAAWEYVDHMRFVVPPSRQHPLFLNMADRVAAWSAYREHRAQEAQP